MKTKTKLTSLLRLSTITSLAMLFMGSVSFAEDATTSSEYTPSYELEKVDATPATNDFTVTKYEQDSTGAYVEVQYELKVDELGDAEGTAKYFNWSADEDGNLSLKEDTSADVSSGDVVVGVGTNESLSTINSDITESFAGILQESNSTNLKDVLGGVINNSDDASNYFITGDFVANGIDLTFSSTESGVELYGQGGAIYLENNLGGIESNFIANYISVNSESSANADTVIHNVYATAFGGAISLYSATIDYITGDFISNYVEGNVTASNKTDAGADISGGAIFLYTSDGAVATINLITGDFISNYVISNIDFTSTTGEIEYQYTSGGAISNIRGYIGEINGDFIENYVKSNGSAAGGAIYNNGGTIGDITGDFIGNAATSSAGNVYGGTIYNTGTIGNIAGDFISNSATASATIQGGVIYNSASKITTLDGDFYKNIISGNYVLGGLIYNLKSTEIGDITGDFTYNEITSTGTQVAGGIIYNNASKIASIDSDFTNNTLTAKTIVAGGIIYNTGSTAYIYDIEGDFVDNVATGASITGGIIYNNSSANIGDITGDVIGNTATANSTLIKGGIIYNSSSDIGDITGDFTNNTASATSYILGGIIYNNSSSEIGDIEGDFTYNKATANSTYLRGGIIYNSSSDIGDITGDVTNNTATAGSTLQGGIIYNYSSSEIGDITGDVTNNTATAGSYLQGGIIYNSSSDIGDITGDFTNNTASSDSWLQGGIIYNYYSSEIGDITGDFTNNTATAGSTLKGGIIYNSSSTIAEMSGDFIDNTNIASYVTTSTDSSLGGVIYNSRTITSIEGDFTNNALIAYSDGSVYGGAVYNTGTISFVATSGSYNYTYNYATSLESEYDADSTDSVTPTASDDENGGFLYQTSTGSTTFNTAVNTSITIGTDLAGYDSIAGTGTITKTGEGTLTVNSSMASYTGTLNVEEGTMEYTNEAILGASEVNVYSILSGDIEFATDADLNVYINSNNAGKTVLDGNMTYTGNIDVYINDIASLLGSTTSVLGNEYSEDIILVMDSNLAEDSYTLIRGTYDITIGNSVTIEQGDASATYSISEEAGSSDVNIAVEGDYSLTDTTSTSTLNIANATTGSGTEASASVDVGTLSVDSKVETAIVVENVDLKDAEVSMDSEGDVVAVSAKTDTTISGTVSVNADNASSAVAVEVANESGNITLDDGASISSTASGESSVAITNTHTGDGESKGLNISLKGSASVSGSIVANSPLTITGDTVNGIAEVTEGGTLIAGYLIDGYTLTVKGDITTANSDVDSTESEDITIEDAILVVDGSDFENGVNINTGAGKIILTAAGLSVTKATITTASIEIDTNSYATIANSTITGAIDNQGSVTITDSTFANNESDTNGGAIVNSSNGDNNYSTDTQATISLTNTDFTNNTVTTTSNSAYGGAIYNYNARDGYSNSAIATITNITASSFTENKVEASSNAYGGAIANNVGTSDSAATIGDISGSFTANEATSLNAYGGAIANIGYVTTNTTDNENEVFTASIANIDADFEANKVTSTAEYTATDTGAYGGAIANIVSPSTSFNSDYSAYGYPDTNTSEIGSITGTFTENEAYAYSVAYGGAIYNSSKDENIKVVITSISASFSGNKATSTAYMAYGGAIANVGYASIGYIAGSFTGNEATSSSNAYGGAIYNTGTVGDIDASFTENKATSTSYSAYGGAIYNEGSIGDIDGDFTGNWVESDNAEGWFNSTYGGAIYNEGNIGDITGVFTNNSATSVSYYAGEALGGAIYNTGTITSLSGDFSANSAIATGYYSWAAGGAICNYASSSASISITNSTFTGNYVDGGSWAEGGAIYNYYGTVNITDSSFVNNHASGAGTYGGAIYAGDGTINFYLTTGESYSYGNWAGVDESSADDANGGFLYMYSGTAKFDIGSDASLTIGDGTAGYDSIAGTGTINKTGTGTLTVNSSMEYFTGTVNVTEGTFNLANVLGGDLVIGTDSTADFNIYITENNTVATDSTLSVGTVAADSTAIVKSISATDAESVDVYIEDIALVLGTTTTLTNSNTNITWNLDSTYTSNTAVSLADNILTIANSVALDTASGATVSSETGSVVLSVNNGETYTMSNTTLTVDSVSGNVTVGSDATLTLDTITGDDSLVILNKGTVETTSSLTLVTATEADAAIAGSSFVAVEGTLAATVEGSSIDLVAGTTELAGDLTLSGNIVLGDSTDSYTKEESTFSGSYTLTLDDATIYIYDDSDLTLNTSTVSGSTLLIQGEEGSDAAVNLGTITVSDSDVTTAVSTNSNVSGAIITFGTDEDVSGIEVSSSDVEITGSITVSNTGNGEVIAVEVTDESGIVTLGNEATISATGGTAITNTHEEGEESNGLNLVLNGATASVVGDIVANSPLSISVAQEEITNGTWTASALTVTGNIITNSDDVNDPENNDITITDVDVTVSGYVTTGGGDISITDGSLNVSGVINLSDGEETTGSISLVGSDLTIGTDSTIDSITMTTGTDGTMSSVSGAGASSLADDSITIVVSAAMLKDSTFTISKDENLTNALADVVDADFSLDTSTGTEITITELTYFQNKEESYTANEDALAYALDNISADGESVGDTDYDAKVALKLAADSAGLSSYVMSNYSQIAEVNTMLLSNQNFANVNRARSILEKSAGVQIEDEDGSVSIENEDGTISVVDASEVSLIKYSNVAQLQVISLMGNKNASNGVAGYEYYSVGSTANFDEILSERALIGASIGGTYNKVTGDAGESANSTTFLLNAYAVYASEGLELFGNIGYAHFWNEGYNAGSKADWDSDAFNALIGISYDLETSVDGLTITPLAMLNMVLQDSESASYSNGVDVNSESYFSAKLMLGFEFEYAISSQFNAIIRTMYMHEMGDDSYDFTYGVGSYLAGINYQGSSAGKDSAVIGLGLSYDFSETCTAYFDYNAYVYESLITHSLNLSVALKF